MSRLVSSPLAHGLLPCLAALALACSGGTEPGGDSTTYASLGSGPGDSESGDSGDGDGDTDTGDGDTDTGEDSFCGDQICDPLTETCQDCQADCGICPFCGDGMCNGDETCMLCALDCEVCPGCGDGVCDGQSETCANCPQDCTEGCNEPSCGDMSCNGDETCQTCEQDCGMCAPSCGDGECNGGEDCGSCEQDCGACANCPNNSCDADESCVSCPEDCGGCTCPCSDDPNFDNFCSYGPNTPDCPMTQPGGYCDPNGDQSYEDGDWNMGFFDYMAQCG